MHLRHFYWDVVTDGFSHHDITLIFILVGVMDIEEGRLSVPYHCPKYGTEMPDVFHPVIMVHITRRSCMYCPESRNTIKIIWWYFLIGDSNRRQEALSIFLWEYEDWSPEGWMLTILNGPYMWDIAPIIHSNNGYHILFVSKPTSP